MVLRTSDGRARTERCGVEGGSELGLDSDSSDGAGVEHVRELGSRRETKSVRKSPSQGFGLKKTAAIR